MLPSRKIELGNENAHQFALLGIKSIFKANFRPFFPLRPKENHEHVTVSLGP
jgi:hypothetical protein